MGFFYGSASKRFNNGREHSGREKALSSFHMQKCAKGHKGIPAHTELRGSGESWNRAGWGFCIKNVIIFGLKSQLTQQPKLSGSFRFRGGKIKMKNTSVCWEEPKQTNFWSVWGQGPAVCMASRELLCRCYRHQLLELDPTPGHVTKQMAAALGPCTGMGIPIWRLMRAGCSSMDLTTRTGAVNLVWIWFSRRNVHVSLCRHQVLSLLLENLAIKPSVLHVFFLQIF